MLLDCSLYSEKGVRTVNIGTSRCCFIQTKAKRTKEQQIPCFTPYCQKAVNNDGKLAPKG